MTGSFIFTLLVSYLLGAIPFGLLISRWRGVNIRQVGSGNIGATNVSRALGWKWAAVVGLLDFSKGFVVSLMAVKLGWLNTQSWQCLLILLAPILGHIFPIWLKFAGGKGVSTTFGVLAGLIDWRLSLFIFLTWMIALKLIKVMSLVNLVLFALLPIIFLLTYQSYFLAILTFMIWGLITWAHRENVKRLLTGKEKKLNV